MIGWRVSWVACRACVPLLFRVVCAVFDRVGGIFDGRGKAFVTRIGQMCASGGAFLSGAFNLFEK